MSKRGVLVIVGVAVIAALLVGGQLLFSRSSNPTASGSTGSAAQLGALKPLPRVAVPKVPTRRLTAPEAAGAPLGPLADAPGGTISGLRIGTIAEGTAYAVRVRPIGFGPSSSLGSQLVVHVDSATAQGGGSVNSHVVDANLVVLLDTRHGGTILAGGAYDATLTFRSDGHTMVPVLSAAKPAS